MSATPRGGNKVRAGGTLLPITLGLFVVVTALAVVQIKNEHRRLTVKAEALRVENETLDLEWTQLQLEEATLAQQARVEPIARAQFSLVEPSAYQIIETENYEGRPVAPAAAAISDVADPGSAPGGTP
ncbi:cell division protein FtsL [Nevskia ramosa]|uniref:cell division protein FtsL n=1 Tax=Nevskia ramosa TaxID=64002 RepID=UPI0023562608